MIREASSLSRLKGRSRGARNLVCFCKCTVLLLVLAVPALSTVAKTSSYLPSSNLGRYMSAANKMEVNWPPVVYDRGLLEQIVTLIPPRPQVRTNRQAEPVPEIRSIGVTISLQHRSPPSSHV